MAWYESEAFWDLGKPFMFGPAAWDRARGEVEAVIRFLGVPAGGRILDLCCGPGRHALELARRGFSVTGVDRYRPYLDSARSAANTEGLDIEFVECDMREFVRAEALDGAINLFTSFGYFEDSADDHRVAENLCASLKPGARLVIDVMGKEILVRWFQPRSWSEVDGVLALEERALERDLSWVRRRDIYVTPQGRYEVRIGHRIYSGAELRGLLESAGFGEVRLYGGFDGSSYDLEAKRLLAVATK
jgi:SAM-dependent methyltransferase